LENRLTSFKRQRTSEADDPKLSSDRATAYDRY